MGFFRKTKTEVFVVVYNRINNLEIWLGCWAVCISFDVTFTIIHNYDGDYPDIRFENLCNKYSVNYIPRKNIGMDLGAFQDVCLGRIKSCEDSSDVIFWLTDDAIPMRKDFIVHFIHNVLMHDVGICCSQLSTEWKFHARSNCLCIKTSLARKLYFSKDHLQTRQDCYELEHQGNTITDQCIANGLKATQISTGISDFIWDTGHFGYLNLWSRHQEVFPSTAIIRGDL